MLIPVLKSINEMLEMQLEDTKEPGLPFLRCAKTLLEKTILGLLEGEMKANDVQARPAPRVEKIVPPDDGKEYVVDAPGGKLVSVRDRDGKEIDGETMIELDGMAFRYMEAKGRAFKKGRVL